MGKRYMKFPICVVGNSIRLRDQLFQVMLVTVVTISIFKSRWVAKHVQTEAHVSSSVQLCRVALTHSCHSDRESALDSFTRVYQTALWGTSESSHTRSGAGSTIMGAFETIMQLEPKFRELNITSIADVPSGDCGWQFALTTINSAEAYFGGDITRHVAEGNARRYENHLNKVFAFWDIVTCSLPRWHTTCDPTPRPFDVIIVRDVIQHMTIENAMRAVKNIVMHSGVKYLAVTSYSDVPCVNQCKEAVLGDGGAAYKNNLHCQPWNLPVPFFSIFSHPMYLTDEGDYLEMYRIHDLRPTVEAWPDHPCD